MNNVNKTVGRKITSNAGKISLLILAAMTAISGIAMTVPGIAYADEPHKQRCISVAGDGGDAGRSTYNSADKNKQKAGDGKGGKAGRGHIGTSDTEIDKSKLRAKGGDGGKGVGGSNLIDQSGGDGGDGGKSKLACIIVDPDLTIKPVLVVPPEAFEPHPYR
jgi:hypothetical protein